MAYVRKREKWKIKKQVLWGIADFLPISGFLEEGENCDNQAGANLWNYLFYSPLQSYLSVATDIAKTARIDYSYDMILLQDGNDKQYSDMMQLAMLEENGGNAVANEATETMSNAAAIEIPLTEPTILNIAEFIPATDRSRIYTEEELHSYQFLLDNFYIVDDSTQIPASLLDTSAMLEMDMRIDREIGGPQILIYHTHSQEGFADSVPGDTTTTIVGAGEVLAQILRDKYGYEVLHHTGEYDVIRHDYAYSYAEPEIAQILADNPSIQVVIDLHRDEVAADRKLVTQINGQDTAQIMFFNDLSYLNDIGAIDYLYNPNLFSNLAFSFRMQLIANEYYPGLTRRIYLRGYRYNMHLAAKYLLIELGAQTNTVAEIQNACEPLAHILDLVIEKNER